MRSRTYLFVGERPSAKAVRIGATWRNQRLAGRTLADALRAADLRPEEHRYTNLYRQPVRGAADAEDERRALARVRRAARTGAVVVGMGRIVCRVLERERIPHIQMWHPARRGAARKREVFQAHVADVLAAGREAAT